MDEGVNRFPMPPMQCLTNLLSIANAIRPYMSLFDPRTCASFKAVIEVLLWHAGGRQPEFALRAKKSVSALQYFFRSAKWSADAVNAVRLSIIRKRRNTADRRSDILILDGTPMEKDRNCRSEGVGHIFDNRQKRVVNGYEAFGAAVLTLTGIVYPLRLMLFLPERWLSQWHAWKNFLSWCFKTTKAWLVVIDRGFRNPYLLAFILRKKREFLVRATHTMPVWVPMKRKEKKHCRGRKKRFSDRRKKPVWFFCKRKDAVATANGLLWLLPDVIVDAWKNEVQRCCSVIVYHRNGFRDPLVIVFSRKDITLEQARELVHTYHKRWTIESTFLELKTSFGLEGFRLTSIEAIERWFALCLVAHSILQGKHLDIPPGSLLARFISWTLRQYRNIKERTLLNLKLFLEMCHSHLYGLQRRFAQFLEAPFTSCQ